MFAKLERALLHLACIDSLKIKQNLSALLYYNDYRFLLLIIIFIIIINSIISTISIFSRSILIVVYTGSSNSDEPT